MFPFFGLDSIGSRVSGKEPSTLACSASDSKPYFSLRACSASHVTSSHQPLRMPAYYEKFRYLTSNTHASCILTLNSHVFQNMTLSVRILLKWEISALFQNFANFNIFFWEPELPIIPLTRMDWISLFIPSCARPVFIPSRALDLEPPIWEGRSAARSLRRCRRAAPPGRRPPQVRRPPPARCCRRSAAAAIPPSKISLPLLPEGVE